MAEIGKVVVSIEARIGSLEAGLVKAELAIRKSGDRMAAAQDSLVKKFSRSWVEISSKITVVTQALDLVSKSMAVIVKIGPAFDKSLTPEQSRKAIAELQQALESLPLGLGSVAALTKEIMDQVTGWADELERIEKTQERIAKLTAHQAKSGAMLSSTSDQIRLARLQLELAKADPANKLQAQSNIAKERAEIERERAAVDVQRRRQEYEKTLLSETRPEDLPEYSPATRWQLGMDEEKYQSDRAMRRQEQADWDRGRELAPQLAAKRAEVEMLAINTLYNSRIALVDELLKQGLEKQAADAKELADAEKLAAMEAAKLESGKRQLFFADELERTRKNEERNREKSLKDQKSELEKLIALEEERLAGRPDVSTGSIQTALGSFTIAMPEGQRIQKAQLEKLEDLRGLLRNIERQMRRMGQQSMGDFPVIPAA